MNMQATSEDGTLDALHTHQVVLFAVASLAELRESDTASHLLRVRHYVRLLAEKLRSHPVFAPQLSSAFIETLCASVCMYDLGTVAIPDRILLKPGRLTPDELAIMKSHTTQGYEAIVQAEKLLGQQSPMLACAKELALSHHEKWNGKGYPRGLRETQIPLAARLVAVADVYDALISNKIYRQGMAHDAAVAVIVAERGLHFEPEVVDAFVA
ncbi:MAG: HD domain-containing protein, partial [Rhodoferax sp.]|nr:HD domain-containing protein [Rhodoferax sp.]